MTIKSRVKIRFENGNWSSNAKLTTSLGQQRIKMDEFFDYLIKKESFLHLKKGILITVYLIVYNYLNYKLLIKLPSTSTLCKRALGVTANIGKVGYLLMPKKRRYRNTYIITQYILYEIVRYKYKHVLYNEITFNTLLKKELHSLRSNGIYLYIC